MIFQAVWPRRKEKIDIVVNNIERLTTMMRDEVTLQHIKEEYELRARSLAHFDQETEFQELQKFETLRTRVSPLIYDQRLDWLLNRSCQGSAEWLVSDESFLKWLDASNPTVRLLWLRGIPGAGKYSLPFAH